MIRALVGRQSENANSAEASPFKVRSGPRLRVDASISPIAARGVARSYKLTCLNEGFGGVADRTGGTAERLGDFAGAERFIVVCLQVGEHRGA